MDKVQWRALLRQRRSSVPEEVRQSEAQTFARLLVGLAESSSVVCAYVPHRDEPGSLAMLDALVEAGKQVLIPIAERDSVLDWGTYSDVKHLVSGHFGLLEPGGQRRGPLAITTADLIVVPALGVDRRGVRLGKGRGHYDRSLALLTRAVPLVALVRDDELVDELPSEPHDVRMTAALTPVAGLVKLG